MRRASVSYASIQDQWQIIRSVLFLKCGVIIWDDIFHVRGYVIDHPSSCPNCGIRLPNNRMV